MQLLRGRRRPVAAQHLADRMSVSVRTVYRDTDERVGMGAAIDGSAAPKDLRDKIGEIGLWAQRPRVPATAGGIDLGVVREAVRCERRLVVAYRDAAGAATEREVWPIALGHFDGARVVAAWSATEA